MSNIFLIDEDENGKEVLKIDGDTSIKGSFALDGYVIDPSGASVGEVLMFDGYTFVAAAIHKNNVQNLIAALDSKADNSRLISTMSGQLVGGGDLSEDRMLGLEVSGVVPGTYSSVTVDAFGRVTAGSELPIEELLRKDLAIDQRTLEIEESKAARCHDMIKIKHLNGVGDVPVIMASSGTGVGATALLSRATDLSGLITLIMGTGLSGNKLATVTFASVYEAIPKVVLFPANSDAAADTNGAARGVYVDESTMSTASFDIVSVSDLSLGGWAESKVYQWYYIVLQ